MSRKRAKYLLDLTKKEEYLLRSVDKNSEILLHTVERDIAITAGDRIEFYTSNGNKTDTIRFYSQNLTALAYDEVHNMLLYVSKETENDAICGYNMTSVEYECYVQRNGRDIQGLAFDPVTELLYFTDTKERSINSFSFKSGSKNNVYGNLVIKMDVGIPTDIAVDHCRRYIYWINTNLTRSTIERARFDGSGREVIITATYNSDLHSLVINQQTNTIYWVEPENHLKSRIYSANLDGTNRIFLFNDNYADANILWLIHPSTLTVLKNHLFFVDSCSNCGPQQVWNVQTPEIQTANYKSIIKINTESAPGIVANYKMKDQFQGLSDCVQIPNNNEMDDSFKVAKEFQHLFCVHGTKVNGQSLCKCTPGYTGVRCEISLCKNFCLHGICSYTEEGLPECRCDAGYSGERCEVNACFQYCLNNGTCTLNEADEPFCECVGEYEGERCDVPLNVNNYNCSSSGVEEPACQCVGSREGSRRPDEHKTTTPSPYYLIEKNITLADLLENWSKRGQ